MQFEKKRGSITGSHGLISSFLFIPFAFPFVSAIAVTEFMIEEPPRNPVWAVRGGSCQAPVVASILIPALSYSQYRFVF